MDAAVARSQVVEDQDVDARPVPWAAVNARLLDGGQRRLEARTYLTDGYGIRQRLLAVPDATVPLSQLAEVWQPPRLKGFVVRDGAGLPFLSAGQVFEARPRVRKWLSRALTAEAERRYVDTDWLLLSCSGDVGKLTAVYPEHLGKLITHDLLRIVPRDKVDYGWLYAYLRTPSFYAISRSAQYGHMIKHLEPEHVQEMPVVMPDVAVRTDIGGRARKAIELRVQSRDLQADAEEVYRKAVNPRGLDLGGGWSQVVRASELASGRRRMEGQYYRPNVRRLEQLVRSAGARVDRLAEVSHSVELGSRFKRFFGPKGTPYRSAGELFDVNARVTKRIYASLLPGADDYMLHAGWVVMACSGQTYGLLGRTIVLTDAHEGVFGSHDLIRIIPDGSRIRTGYLQTALNHPEYGRPLVVRNAFGTSVPHLDPVDVRGLPIPRFTMEIESEIADLCDESIRLSAEADHIETRAIAEAELIISSTIDQHGRVLACDASDNA